ncbi:MAG: FAD-dependent oxidoreductase, partial [Candidatus Geothermincolales bacterium]
MEYLIIGNGGAGLTAARTLRNLDAGGKITIVDEETHPCYYRMRLPDYICGWKDRDSVFFVTRDFYREKGIEFLGGRRVTRVVPEKRLVELDGGEALSYGRLLIASGARPRPLPVPGSDLDGVVYLRTLDQAEDIIRRGKEASEGVVLGGGLLGVELARCFNELGLRTHYLIREDRFWPQMLDVTGSALVEQVLAEKGVVLRKGEGIQEIRGEGGKVTSVLTSSGEELPADMVGVAIGVVCNLEFLEGSGIETRQGVLVDDRLRSNVEDVYAAGDVAQAYDPVLGEHRVVTSWLNALRQGETAARNMAGEETALGGVVPFNVIVIYGLPVASVGQDEASAADAEVIVVHLPEERRYGLGVAAFELGSAYTRHAPLQRLARPVL